LRRTSSFVVLSNEETSKNRSSTLVSQIQARAAKLAGHLPVNSIENLQIVRYLPHERHGFHYDYLSDPQPDEDGRVCHRIASFFVFLEDACTGGETYFPYLTAAPPASDGRKFSRPNNAGDDATGLLVKPLKGNAIFWLNFHPNGTADERTLHSGLEIKDGVKYGMNILVQSCY
jgi:prolyl 4-hydroxylase